MGKQSGKKKKQLVDKSDETFSKQSKVGDNSPKTYDKDMAVFISMSRELKDEGNKLFQKRDHEGAMLKYEKALKLLPRNHIDVSYLRSNMAACYMQMGIGEYPRAIHECNLALEVTPNYSKALLKRARCYEALNRLDLALRDVNSVLNMESNNLMAMEIAERVKKTLKKKGLMFNGDGIELPSDNFEPSFPQDATKVSKEKTRKKKKSNVHKVIDSIEENKTEEMARGKNAEDKLVVEEKITTSQIEMLTHKVVDTIEENKTVETARRKNEEDKLVVEDKISTSQIEMPKKRVKLVLGEDIRWAQIPIDCTILQVREAVGNKFPTLRDFLIKYKDEEGDLVTIVTDEELKWAEALGESEGSFRLYVVNPELDSFFEKFKSDHKACAKKNSIRENGDCPASKQIKKTSCIEDWIVAFAELLKDHLGFESDTYLDLHELGLKLYSEAMEETVTSEAAQDLFEIASEKFQEMVAVALFNWGNVHMSRARKRVNFTEHTSKESALTQIESACDWAQNEYVKAGKRYEEAVRIKPDFYEGFLALGQQHFERAKLSWYYAIGSNVNLATWPSTDVLQLYNSAEDNLEKGIQMWEEWEEQRGSEFSKPNNLKGKLEKMGLNNMFNDISKSEAEEQAAAMRSHINLLWGTVLYERSIVEFKLGLPVWHECLEVAVEKFILAGASSTDIAVMIKNHCSNNDTHEGLGFKIDEIVQAWNEMYEAKKLQRGIPSFRLESLFRRRVSKLYNVLEQN